MSAQYLSKNWTVESLLKAIESDTSARDGLIGFLQERYTERFFDPIEILENKSTENKKNAHLSDATDEESDDTWRYGFAIVSLCCLLIETFASYRRGLPSSDRGELDRVGAAYKDIDAKYRISKDDYPRDVGEIYRCFFESERPFFTPIKGGQFYQNIRNGLLHQSQTKGGWRITVSKGQLWDEKSRTLNRTILVAKLRDYFKSYLAELKSSDWDSTPWITARRKMFWLCKLSEPSPD